MIGYGNNMRFSISRMESLPESSKPFDDISDHGISDHIGDDIIGDLVKVDRGMSNNQEIDVRDRLTFSNLATGFLTPM